MDKHRLAPLRSRSLVDRAEHARRVLTMSSADRVGAMLVFSDEEASVWLDPISAPKDGRPVLINAEDWASSGEYEGGMGAYAAVAVWSEDGWEATNTPYCSVRSRAPSGWLPIP